MSCELEKAIEILTQEWEKSVRDYRYQNPQKLDREYALDIAIQALREKLNLTPPQPLTLEELKGMDGKPVYAACLKSDTLSCWGYVTDGCVVGYHANFGFSEHSKTWLAYPTEPRREETDGQ